LEQFADETANPPAPPWCGHRGFRESDFSSYYFLKQSKSGISERLKSFLHAILPRLVREQDHATHETLELAERESSVDRALNPHGRRGDSVGSRRATGAYARSGIVVALAVVALWPERSAIAAKNAAE
jgi:hypothetical protein